MAVAAVVSGSFSLAQASLEFLTGAAGGIAIGIAVGWAAAQIRRRLPDDQLNVTISLLTGYAAYVPAEAVGASAVLAAVSAGLFMAIRGPQILPVRTRLQGYFVWDILDFLVNAILFVLIGLQLRSVVDGLPDVAPGTLVGYALAVTGVVVAVRIAWFFTTPYLVWAIEPRAAESDRGIGARGRLMVARSGMRGAVALALPLTTAAGERFPQRELIIFLSFVVIMFTLIAQGLSLPALVARLGIRDADRDTDAEKLRARLLATKAALREIDSLADEEWTRDDSVRRLHAMYDYRKRRLAARAGKIDDEDYEERSLAWQQMIHRVIAAQRDELLRVRSTGQVSNETTNRILRELDLEESRLEI